MSEYLQLPANAKTLSQHGITAEGVKLDDLVGSTLMVTKMEWLNRGREQEGVRFYCHRVTPSGVERAQLLARGFSVQVRRVAEQMDKLDKLPDGKFAEYVLFNVKREGNSYAIVDPE